MTESVDPSARLRRLSLSLRLRPDGWTESIKLSGCTYADAIHLCAPGAWQNQAEAMTRDFLAQPAMQAIKDEVIETVELELHEDGSLSHITMHGCSVEHAFELCRFIVKFDVLATNWLTPYDEQDQ